MRRNLAAALLMTLAALPLRAQKEAWAELVAESDSIGPVTPPGRIAPDELCPPGMLTADSIEVTGPGEEFLLSALSLRTRGNWSAARIPRRGSGRFALRELRCEPKSGRPFTFVMERDHRYLYLVANLRPNPTYQGLRFRSGGRWSHYRWFPETHEFRPTEPSQHQAGG